MSEENTLFSVNQKVVYPSQGVGTVTEIFKKVFQNKEITYYKIYLEVSDMYVMVPTEKAKDLGIRPIVSAEVAEKALELINDEFEPPISDWKLRYQMNLDLLKRGTIEDIVSIVRCLYHRSKVKELPILERKLYDNARRLLEDEIAEALGKSSKEVEALLHSKLEPLGTKTEKKPLYQDVDDEDDEFGEDMDGVSKGSDDGEDDGDDEDENEDIENGDDDGVDGEDLDDEE